MPYGAFKPVAKISVCFGFPSPVIPRNILMSPAWLSAKKTSPLGAVEILRGSLRPVANNSTLNPAGACGQAFFGRATMRGQLSAELVAYGAGRSFPVILWIAPGFSERKSVNGGLGGGADLGFSQWKNIVDITNTKKMTATTPKHIANRSKALRRTFGPTDWSGRRCKSAMRFIA